MDEQRLEGALRQGPPFATRYVPAPLALDERPILRRPMSVGRLVLIITVTALLVVGMLAGLAALGRLRDDPAGAPNGWIAFARYGSGPGSPDGWVERDIYLVREGEAAHRIVGSDAESLDQVCPAFSRDGRRLAHGEADTAAGYGFRDAVLVISDIDGAGNASQALRIDVGGSFPPPCATWSADGRFVAFAVNAADGSAAGSGLWIATTADGAVKVLSGLSISDLEWSADGSQLAISGGQADRLDGLSLRDGSIRLYDADSGEMRTLVGPSGVGSLTWSPDGGRIAYQRGGSDGGGMDQEIWVVEVDGSGEHRLTHDRFGAVYGVGPVWSPIGDRIVYQRMKSPGTEAHHVVLLSPDDGSEVVLPDLRLPRTDEVVSWRPDSVTWSPDGKELLYSAWVSGQTGRALISRPLEPGADPVMVQDGIDASGENRSWGRLPVE